MRCWQMRHAYAMPNSVPLATRGDALRAAARRTMPSGFMPKARKGALIHPDPDRHAWPVLRTKQVVQLQDHSGSAY